MDSFLIISDGIVFSRDDFADSHPSKEEVSCGTRVIMSLNNHSKKTTVEVFDRFSNVDEGFIKTRIPLSRIFSAPGPVSRSEARRLGELISRFNEIELDFSSVTEVGQAFVRELFVVWQKRNPEVRLFAENTCENVDKMIKRVKNTK